jgi:hypothetical protein
MGHVDTSQLGDLRAIVLSVPTEQLALDVGRAGLRTRIGICHPGIITYQVITAAAD